MEDFKMLPTVLRRRNLTPDTWFDQFFNNSFLPSFLNEGDSSNNPEIPAVNIEENEKEYIIAVAAPGLEKKDFSISLNSDLLTISAKNNNHGENKSDSYLCQEFNYTSFSRSFSLPENSDSNKIKASLKNGVLSVVIPKNKTKDKIQKEISIS
jgi:HSP20 family protein